MALANINVAVTESNIVVDLNNTTVDVTSTTSNIVVGAASSARFIEDVYDAGTLNGNITLDVSNGTIQNILLSGNVTGLTLNNFGIGSSLTAIFTQSGLGGSILDTTTYTSNWTNYNFANEYTDFDTNPSHYSILNIFNDGNEYYTSLITETAPPVQNSDLANANIIVNGTTISLGSSGNIANFGPLTTDDLTEGSTNQYYTDTRSRAAVSVTTATPSGSGALVYNNSTGVFTFTPGQGNYGDSNVVTLLSSGISSNITTTANVSGNYILGNGSLLSGLPETYNNANVISLFTNYSNVISTSANLFSSSKVILGSQDFVNSLPNGLSTAAGLAITPLSANAGSTPPIQIFSPRLDGTLPGNALPSNSEFGHGVITLYGTSTSGNIHTNGFQLNVGQNPKNTGSNHTGIIADFYSQNTITSGSPGTYTNGGYRNEWTFIGDTRIVGPINMGAQAGGPQDENYTQCVIEGFNIYPYSLKVEQNATVKGSIIAGSDVSNTHIFTGNLDVTGNITTTGNLNYQNVTDLYVTDQKITLNANAATDATVEIIANRPVAGANTVLRWNETSDAWQFTNNGSTYYPIPTSTSDLAEGTNLYYTDARSRAAVSVTSNTPNGNGSLSYDNGTGVFTFTPANVIALLSNYSNVISTSANIEFTANNNVIDYSGGHEGPMLKVTNTGHSSDPYIGYSNISGSFEWTTGSGSTFAFPTSTSDVPEGSRLYYTTARANAAIEAHTGSIANLTGNIKTTGNLQVNPDTDVSGLSGLTFDSATNNLGLGTPTPKAALHIRGTSNESQIYMTEYNGTSSAGIDLRTFRAGGTEASPTVTPKSDRIWESLHYAYDGVGTSGDGISTGFQNAFSEQIITDPVVDHAANTVPVFKQYYTYLDGDTTTTLHALMRMRSNGDIQFNAGDAFAYTGAANTVISNAGNITTVGNINSAGGTLTGVLTSNSNITTTANITGGYIIAGNDAGGDGTFIGDINGAVQQEVRNETGATLNKGKAVYLTGTATGDTPHVALADNSNVSLMPVIGIVKNKIAIGAKGEIVTSGQLNIGTHGFAQGSDLFVNGTGDLQVTAPTGEANLIQKIGKVVSSTHIIVQGAFRTNATPNLNENNIFIGNAANRATTVALNNLTSDIGTTGNLDLNSSTAVDNLYGLKWDSSVNKFISSPDAGTTAPTHFITVEKEGTDLDFIRNRVARSGAFGTRELFEKSEGTLASPTALGSYDEIWQQEHAGWDGNKYEDSLGMHTFQDGRTASVSADTVPLAYEIYGKPSGDTTAFDQSFISVHSDGYIAFNDSGGARGFNNKVGNANISRDGSIVSAANITAVGNISGNYILGNGSQLTGVSTNAFGTVTVAGQTNIQASQGNAVLDLATSGDITLSTSGNTLTIGGSGGGYGNANVTTYLASGTSTGNVAFTGNLIIESGNTSLTVDNYFGNVNTGNVDQILFNSDPGLFIGQPITFSGTTNSNLAFLNGNTYYVRSVGGGSYNLFTDAGTLTGLTSGLGQEAPSSLVGAVRQPTNCEALVQGNVKVGQGGTLHADAFKSTTSGGTISFSGVRMSDVGLGSGGTNFFFPETGGNTEGGILVAHSDNVGTWETGLDVITDEAGPEVINYTNSRSSSLAIEEVYKRSRGTTASPAILEAAVSGAWDRVHEVEYYGYDGNSYEMTLGEHVYVDNSVGVTIGDGVMPLTKEIYCKYLGQPGTGNSQSLVKFRPNKHIEFNASTGTRGFGTQGNANIQMDGSIYSAQTVDALNIAPRQFLKLKNYTTTEINALTGMAAGDTVFNTTESTICFYTGSAWNKVTSTAL